MNVISGFGILVLLGILCQSSECLFSHPKDLGFIRNNSTLSRIKRQSTACKGDTSKFQCETNPDCIDIDQQCDGKEDCPDGSDEKQSLCDGIICPAYLFRCDYGACISGDQRCNGVKDCKDNSDEAGCPSGFEKINTNCRSDEFTCNNGQCIDTDARCSGTPECEDKSDETEELCLNIECPGYTYKCRYGACVDGTAKCNGIQECYDNSDEDEKTCGAQTPKPPVTPITEVPPTQGSSKGCVTPPQPANGNWTYFHNPQELASKNIRVSIRTQIVFKCNDMFQLSTGHDRNEEIVYCRDDNQWSVTVFPECQQLCTKYYNRYHAILQCKRDGSIVPCDKATDGTTLTFQCDTYYEQDTTYDRDVCRDGSWIYPEPRCRETCGEKQVSAQTLVVNGKEVTRGHYPWVVALFSSKDSDNPNIFKNICGGSLLSTSFVLTAAHCLTNQRNGNVYHIKYFRAAAGKYYNKFMDERDKDTAQYLPFKIIHKHPDYRGEIQNFAHDIALIRLQGSFALSKVVQPVCYNRLPPLGISGTATITGWGYTTATGETSDVLKELDLEYVDNNKCATELDSDFASQYLISDKLCAGFLNQSRGVCKGDSGGGLVVKNNNNRYFVQGIVSLSRSFLENNLENCDIQKRALFTRVETYMPWISDFVNLNKAR